MTFIITEPCLGTCDTACVEVCPVDCIAGPIDVDDIKKLQAAGEESKLANIQLFIDPEICIDCGACEPECPVEAIFEEDDVPKKWESFIPLNYEFYGQKY